MIADTDRPRSPRYRGPRRALMARLSPADADRVAAAASAAGVSMSDYLVEAVVARLARDGQLADRGPATP